MSCKSLYLQSLNMLTYWGSPLFPLLLMEGLHLGLCYMSQIGFPGGSVVKNPSAMQEMQETWGSLTGWGRFPGERHGTSLQYSCLENPMDREACWATVHRLPRIGHDWSNWACICHRWTGLPSPSTHHYHVYLQVTGDMVTTHTHLQWPVFSLQD